MTTRVLILFRVKVKSANDRHMPVTSNRRVILTEEQGEKSYCIHEVHYDEDGS